MLFLGQQKSEHVILNSADPRVPFGPVGNCIYCENQTDPAELTLEHIIPSGIAGNLELEKSSCRSCATTTGRNEQRCLRQIFDTPRAIHGLRKRKHKDASQSAKYSFIKGGATRKFDPNAGEKREMEFSQSPPNAVFSIITFALPGLLEGLPPNAQIPGVVYVNYDVKSGNAAHLKEGGKIGTDLVKIEIDMNGGWLGQMIAKIAHSYAVSQLGLGTFTPFLQQYIRMRDGASFDTHYIGSGILGEEECIHSIGLYLTPVDSHEGGFRRSHYWSVRLHLFAWRNPLVYYIAVGRPL